MKISSSKSILKGEISVPGSKSHTIRAVAIAAMADGTSKIIAPLISEDTVSALGAASAFGAKITKASGIWTVTGTNGKITAPPKTVDMGNSGTSLRIFSALASLSDSKISFDGDNSLRTRLMQPLLSALEPIGVNSVSANGKCPLSVQGPLKGGNTRVEGKSSQFVTAVLLSCPLAPEDSEIEVFNLNEKPYVEITIDWMKKQNLIFEHNDAMTLFKIKGKQSYKPFELAIPADFSTACFPLVASAVTGSPVRINNLDFNDRQGDKEVFSFMEKMGMKVERGSAYTIVTPGPAGLSGAELDLNATPDALPALAVAACYAKGRTVLGNVPQARIKETDRIACMTKELRKMGAKVEELEDGMIIHGGTPLQGTEVESYADHRIAMALAIAGLNASGKTIINEAESAAVTYPAFYEDFRKIGANFSEV